MRYYKRRINDMWVYEREAPNGPTYFLSRKSLCWTLSAFQNIRRNRLFVAASVLPVMLQRYYPDGVLFIPIKKSELPWNL